MKVKVIGMKFLDFPNSDTGEQVKGVKVFLAVPDSDFVGYGVSAPFIKADTALYKKLKDSAQDFCSNTCNAEFLPGSNGKVRLADIEIVQK